MSAHYQSVALRIAHDALLYGHIDSEIVTDSEALRRVILANKDVGAALGNMVLLGGPIENVMVRHMLKDSPSPSES